MEIYNSKSSSSKGSSSAKARKPNGGCTPNPIDFTIGPFQVAELCDNIYVFGDGIYLSAFVVTTKGVVIIDGPQSLAANLENVVSTVTTKPIHTVIYSHSHEDHVGAVYKYKSTRKIEYIAHENTPIEFRKSPPYNETLTPMPTKIITSKYTSKNRYKYRVGNQLIELWQDWTYHNSGDLAIKFVNQNILVRIDLMIATFEMPSFEFTQTISMADLVGIVNELKDNYLTEWNALITGHSWTYATINDINNWLSYVNDIEISVKEAIQNVSFLSVVIQNGGIRKDNNVIVSADYFDALNSYCRNKMVNEFGYSDGGTSIIEQSCLKYYFYLI